MQTRAAVVLVLFWVGVLCFLASTHTLMKHNWKTVVSVVVRGTLVIAALASVVQLLRMAHRRFPLTAFVRRGRLWWRWCRRRPSFLSISTRPRTT